METRRDPCEPVSGIGYNHEASDTQQQQQQQQQQQHLCLYSYLKSKSTNIS